MRIVKPVSHRVLSLLLAAFLLPAALAFGAKSKAPKVDVNTATPEQLEALPGVGEAYAKKIVAGRPYSSVADLSRAGLPASTIDKIKPLVTASKPKKEAAAKSADTDKTAKTAKTTKSSAAPAPAGAGAPGPGPASRSTASKSAPGPDVAARPAPAKGMVWVNTATKVYHHEGDQWYGKTKEGKYMTEQDAIKAGYRASKEGAPKN